MFWTSTLRRFAIRSLAYVWAVAVSRDGAKPHPLGCAPIGGLGGLA
jgi:hypothetical protein